MNLFERVYGCLAGLALGDALGMPTEFLTREQIGKEFGWVDHPLQAPVWHPHHKLRAGQVTDDTGQSLAVAHAYTLDGSLTAETVARELITWSEQVGENLPLIVGPSTRLALDQIKAGGDPHKTGRKGTTNGASYRAVIVGLVNYRGLERLIPQVVEACLPTHGTTTAISAGVAVASAVAQAMTDAASLESIFQAAQQGAADGRAQGAWAWGTPLEGRIELALRIVAEAGSPEDAMEDLARYVGVDMLVAESVATAFGLVSLAKGDAMRAVIYGANIGGDTDTMAAIAGAICGARQGVEALDGKMLARVEKVSKLDLSAEAERLVSIIEQGKQNDE
jgi:ADP-ribosylglycohydrolase